MMMMGGYNILALLDFNFLNSDGILLGVLYCKPHFEQLFKESGNFNRIFNHKLQLNSSDMDDYRSSNYMLCGTASKFQGCDWKVLRRRTIKKTLGFKQEDG
ncbi:hypothetical protein ZIOFF_036617 [Zingiber officinale]|uniref:Uncharacterized protein n=1 Tax=Zingiber officinale TaxID=94328 RepID=A0A8J5GDY2_ZINOF|nr:hypothetical protein ZIOFF_036617 [Zingiber officinale]